MARVEKPVFISSRSSRGLTPEQVKKSEEEHKRKLLGWRVKHISVSESMGANTLFSNDSITKQQKLSQRLEMQANGTRNESEDKLTLPKMCSPVCVVFPSLFCCLLGWANSEFQGSCEKKEDMSKATGIGHWDVSAR